MSTSSRYPKARKRFGQNFLTDQHVIDDILAAINPEEDQHIVEIGPGRAALTEPLSAACLKLDVVEIDRDLVHLLQEKFAHNTKLTIHQADALSFDFRTLCTNESDKLRIIGNLPYNITTPLLFHLLTQAHHIDDMCFMLQREVVERICAQPGSKIYGRLSIMMQYQCETVQLFTVAPEAFDPVPKVESAIIYLKPKPSILKGAYLVNDLSVVVTTAFSQRRKTIANTLKNIASPADLLSMGIDVKQRPETISLEQYIVITEFWRNKKADLKP